MVQSSVHRKLGLEYSPPTLTLKHPGFSTEKSALSETPVTKRTLDLIFSLMAFLILSPIWPAIIFVLWCSGKRWGVGKIRLGGGKVIFRQLRVGKNGKVFTMHKFVTMVSGSDGLIVRGKDDKRITPFGKFLRATALDELPEIINIIRGEMSIIGPRAIAKWEHDSINIPGWERRLNALPGVMGLAQLNSHRNDDLSKLVWDLQYIADWSIWLDFKLLILGILRILKRSWI